MFQLQSEIVLAITLKYRQHMRVNRGLPVFPSKDSKRETDQLVARKRSHENAAHSPAGNCEGHREAVFIPHSPHFLFYRFHLEQVVKAFQIANMDLGRSAGGGHSRPLSPGNAAGANQRPAASSSCSISRNHLSDRF